MAKSPLKKTVTRTVTQKQKWGCLYKRKNSKNWWIKYTNLEGKKVYLSTGTPYVGVAKRRLEHIRIENNLDAPKDEIYDLHKRFMDTMKNKSPIYHYMLNKAFRSFTEFSNVIYCYQITKPLIKQWLESVIKQGRAVNTVRNYKGALSAFCTYLIDHDYLEVNPCNRVYREKPKDKGARFLDDMEYIETLHVAESNGIFLPIFVALKTGMRRTEVRQMRWEHIIWQGNESLLLVHGKGSKTRTVPIHKSLLHRLQAIKKDKGYVFPGQKGGMFYEKGWRDLLKPIQAAVPKFTADHRGTGTAWHLLRHTFGYRMAREGVPIPILKEIMGHTDIKTTMIYARVANDKWTNWINKA